MLLLGDLTQQVIGAAIEVHKNTGPGLLESAYEECMSFELRERGLDVQRQTPVPIIYKKIKLDCGYRIDLLVNHSIVVELKSVDILAPVHEAQILTYLRFSEKRVGLLINFNVTILKDGLKRYVL